MSPFMLKRYFPGSFRTPKPAMSGDWKTIEIIATDGNIACTGWIKRVGGKYAYFHIEGDWRAVDSRTHTFGEYIDFKKYSFQKRHKQRSTPKTGLYSDIQKMSEMVGETNDCGVKALAVTARIPYPRAHEILKRLGRENGKGTAWGWMTRAYQILGLKMVKVDRTASRYWDKDTWNWVYIYPKGEPTLANVRTVTNLEKALPEKGEFLIDTSNHFIGCSDGQVHCWARGRRHHIQEIYRIERI